MALAFPSDWHLKIVVIHDFRPFRLCHHLKLNKFEIIPAPTCIFYPPAIKDIECRPQFPHNIFLFWISLYKYISLIAIDPHLTTKIKYSVKKPLQSLFFRH